VSGWPGQPVIYEINTAVWLTELSEAAGQRLTLADVPAAAWDDVTPAGVDAVWLMGVWQRSPGGLALAMANPELLASFRDALPDLTSSDVIGSPYCVRSYLVDAAFGGPDALAAARTALHDRGVSLLLDYVPNHVAPDHPWVRDSPELFVRGGEDDIRSDPPAGFAREATYWLAVAIRTSRRGRTSCNSMHSRRRCGLRRPRHWPASRPNVTASAAIWRC
jgi:Alpha amylase, catalytic domain